MTEPSDAEEGGGELPDGARRRFIHRMVNLSLGLWAAAGVGGVGYVTGRYVWPHPDGAATGGERTASFPVSELDDKSMVRLLVEGKPVGVVRHGATLYALGLTCTHLGCLVGWDTQTGQMVCPCHASRFDVNGAVAGGPAPAPLDRYDVRVAGDTVVVG